MYECWRIRRTQKPDLWFRQDVRMYTHSYERHVDHIANGPRNSAILILEKLILRSF